MAKKSRAKRKQRNERQRTATPASPSIDTAALSVPSPASLLVRGQSAHIAPAVAEPSDLSLFFSELELDFFRRGDELDLMPARPTSDDELLWDWGAGATLTKTRVA
jgi:hypothetical protein